METSVLKFGGSSLADAAQAAKAAAIIRSREGCRFVVVSAPGKRFPGDEKVTDLLYGCADRLERGEDPEALFSQVEERYRAIIRELGAEVSLEEDFIAIRRSFARPSRDYLASRGEYLSAKLLAACLGVSFLDAARGIFFRADGTLDREKTYTVLPRLLGEHCRAVIPGFYGSMPDGTIRTFTRGGSDITGAIVARAAGASVYENWTDVSGVMMADPRIVERPRVIREISYRELHALSRGGASVFHEEAICPVREADIPINIRNTNAPADPGTMIVSRTACRRAGITGVSGRTNLALVTVRGKDSPGFGRQVLSALSRLGADPVLLPGEGNSVVAAVEENCPEAACLARLPGAEAVRVERGLCLLTVVGTALEGQLTRQLLERLADEGIDVRLADPCGTGLLLVVSAGDYARAMRTVYDVSTPQRKTV